MTPLLIADLFCGAGGGTSGAVRAVEAMGFEGYTFTGNVGEVTRQIGNAVAVNLAAALVTAILGERVAGVAAEAAS